MILWLSAQRLSDDDDDVSFNSVYFGTLSWICGYIFLQMVVISSEIRFQCNRCSDDLEDGTVHCIHSSASLTFCIYLHLTHVYPYAGTFLIEILVERFLCSDMRPDMKDDVVYSFFDPEISVLKDMIALITPDHVGMFREMYGGILKMVFRLTDRDRSAIHTLLQFYDPGLRCFIFPDYLLGPLMEDYAGILGIQIRNQVPFYATKEEPDIGGISRALYLSPEIVKRSLKEKGKLPGFHLSFLEAKAKEHAELGNWNAVCALIAVSIYGTILFPNQKGFVDINAIRLFVQRNPIPTWIGDVYYSVHNRNEKRRGGLIRCCTQYLYKWFMGYLPTRGAFVLLDRVQGCINYNPTLLKRQMGFAMEVPPFKSEIQETLYFPVEGNQAKLRQVADAWRSIQRKGKFSWGRANNRSFPPFDDWLSKRVELTCLPFPMVDPWYPLIEESPSSVRDQRKDGRSG
ncbi:hypothetical protein KIW84_061100 [Lathyrus oleraceus]|uniref:DUF7745 domain-containing protein n=1 Tax=Pisum sativum TaxID=3888 RepID=A0A9D4W3F7_PEA|nr:hypothetical protein KIW84_061100 [Pisum sativum]